MGPLSIIPTSFLPSCSWERVGLWWWWWWCHDEHFGAALLPPSLHSCSNTPLEELLSIFYTGLYFCSIWTSDQCSVNIFSNVLQAFFFKDVGTWEFWVDCSNQPSLHVETLMGRIATAHWLWNSPIKGCLLPMKAIFNYIPKHNHGFHISHP